jgi:hypothetical protein
MKKAFLTLSLLLMLTSCADRIRENCETTKATGTFERRCQ